MKVKHQLLRTAVIGILAASFPLLVGEKTFASASEQQNLIIAQETRPEVKLELVVDKQNVTVDEEGVETVTWNNVGSQVTVVPGDVLRYVVMGTNVGDEAARNLEVTQPIPQQMVYVMGSATSSNDAKITYSINNGETFVENPTIEVTQPDGTVVEKPAPASAYTHVRWQFGEEIAPQANIEARYQVEVE